MNEQPLIEVEEVDIEEFGKRNEKPPKSKRYIFRVDKTRIVVEVPTLTGAEILSKAGLSSDTHKLYQHKHGQQPVLISPTDTVDLSAPGVERFTTMPKDTTEGLTDAPEVRRQFSLPEADVEYLNRRGLTWEAIRDGDTQWAFVHSWMLPSGYNHETVSIALLIPPSYPDSQIDMVYVKPALARSDGKPINNLSTQGIAGESWQRWSRHRTQNNPWRAGVDDIASHLGLVDDWFRREFQRA